MQRGQFLTKTGTVFVAKNMDLDNIGNVSGMLLYAKNDVSIDLNENFKAGGNSFSVKTLDLSVEFNKIREQLKF